MNKINILLLVLLVLFGTACSSKGRRTYSNFSKPKTYSEDKSKYSTTVNKKYYKHPTMRPYVVRGIKYYPTVVNVGDTFKGRASWYGPDFHGKLTSNGEVYNMYDMTAAHKTLPMNTIVKVTNLRNGLSTVVRINDRGPFVATRIIDLSNKAAKKIKMVGTGTAPVKLEILGFASKGSKTIPTKKQLKASPKTKNLNGFALQIGSFSKIDGALRTQQKYDGTDGYKTIIKDVDLNDKRIFKVWLRGFKSEQEARDYKEHGQFKGAFIVREN
jgi:rare lipoprotein A